MKKILSAIDKINTVLLLLLGTFLGIMILVLSVQVISRTLIGYSLPWSEELARFLMIYSVFIGAALALRYQQLIAIEFIAEKVSEKTRKGMKISSNLCGIVFFIIILFQGIAVMERVHTQSSAALQIPMSFLYAALPIGMVLLTMNAIAVIIDILLNDTKNNVNKWGV
ncbi:TRAP transporter small permease [Halalkalibacter oceani]|uniref:TRAP transporter small permease n=1 Tax=Halalkalibacter oceani TaxID=1653776 RepID=UPI0033940EBB